MTMGPVEIERKVRQHDNDITEIYQMLAHIQGVQGRHTMRLGELGAALGIVDSKVDAVNQKVDRLEIKVDGLDTKMGIVLELLQGERG